MKVAIIEDEKSIIDAINLAFEFRWPGASVVAAATGEDGVALVKKESPELVILDVRLGESSGLDVLSKIKDLSAGTEVIMVTGLGDEATMQEAKSLGANDFLTKPFTADFLNNLLTQKLADLKKAKTP